MIAIKNYGPSFFRVLHAAIKREGLDINPSYFQPPYGATGGLNVYPLLCSYNSHDDMYKLYVAGEIRDSGVSNAMASNIVTFMLRQFNSQLFDTNSFLHGGDDRHRNIVDQCAASIANCSNLAGHDIGIDNVEMIRGRNVNLDTLLTMYDTDMREGVYSLNGIKYINNRPNAAMCIIKFRASPPGMNMVLTKLPTEKFDI